MFKRKSKCEKTKVIVNLDAGFPNSIFIRGEGIPGLSWNKGTQLKNTKKDEWVWESDTDFSSGKFKILINDQTYEAGDNHTITPGNVIRIHPRFQ